MEINSSSNFMAAIRGKDYKPTPLRNDMVVNLLEKMIWLRRQAMPPSGNAIEPEKFLDPIQIDRYFGDDPLSGSLLYVPAGAVSKAGKDFFFTPAEIQSVAKVRTKRHKAQGTRRKATRIRHERRGTRNLRDRFKVQGSRFERRTRSLRRLNIERRRIRSEVRGTRRKRIVARGSSLAAG
jgi:hypothetical protein